MKGRRGDDEGGREKAGNEKGEFEDMRTCTQIKANTVEYQCTVAGIRMCACVCVCVCVRQ